MRQKRIKGYWLKRKEVFTSGANAKARAGSLRLNEQVAHVLVDKEETGYVVRYSVAKWYWEELQRLDLSL
jgi:hypothetical protein